MPADLGLRRRAESVNWQWHLAVPGDLRGHYLKHELRKSCRTTDRDKAKALCAQWSAEALRQFADDPRRLNPDPLAEVAHELAATLGQRVRASVLGADEGVRGHHVLAFLMADAAQRLKASMGPVSFFSEAVAPDLEKRLPQV